jgi:hypothetical protein
MLETLRLLVYTLEFSSDGVFYYNHDRYGSCVVQCFICHFIICLRFYQALSKFFGFSENIPDDCFPVSKGL